MIATIHFEDLGNGDFMARAYAIYDSYDHKSPYLATALVHREPNDPKGCEIMALTGDLKMSRKELREGSILLLGGVHLLGFDRALMTRKLLPTAQRMGDGRWLHELIKGN